VSRHVQRQLRLDHSLAASLTPAQIRGLAASGAVERIEPDLPCHATRESSQASFGITKARADFGFDVGRLRGDEDDAGPPPPDLGDALLHVVLELGEPLLAGRRVRTALAAELFPDRHGDLTVELLAAMLSGIVIMLAAFAMVDLTIRDTNRVTDRVEATSLGRSALEQLVGELNSGCLAPDVSPVMAASSTGIVPAVTSDATDLVFVSGLGDGQSGNPTEHVLTYAANTLTDRAYAFTGGTGANLAAPSTWTFATTPTMSHVLSNVTAFNLQYYSFLNTANTTVNSLNGATALTTLSSAWPATSTEYNAALSVARIDIALTVGPSSGNTAQTVLTDLTDSVVFRVTPPSSIATNYPCD